MAIDPSKNFNSNGVLSTLRKFSTLRKWSKNKFSLNPENNVIWKTECISNTGTFKRFLSNVEESPQFINYTQTLGRPRQAFSESALDQARKKFSDDGTNNEYIHFSEKVHPQEDMNFVKTLTRNVSMRLLNLKKPEEINKRLERAKKSFQASEYEESKKIFENLLGSKHLDTLGKKSEISLYLAAIYLLEKDGFKANKHLEEITNPYLKLLMNEHAEHISDLKEDGSFAKANFYEIDRGSEDEKTVAKKLLESFGKNTPIQNIQ